MCLDYEYVIAQNATFVAFCVYVLLVAGAGIEPASGGYEPPEVPLLYPAVSKMKLVHSNVPYLIKLCKLDHVKFLENAFESKECFFCSFLSKYKITSSVCYLISDLMCFPCVLDSGK